MLRIGLLCFLSAAAAGANPILAHHAWYLHQEEVIIRIDRDSASFDCTFVVSTDRGAKMHWEHQPVFFSLPIWIPKDRENALAGFGSWFDVFQEKGVLVYVDRTERGSDTIRALLDISCATKHFPKALDTFSYWREGEMPQSQRIEGLDVVGFRFGFNSSVARERNPLHIRYRQPHFRRGGRTCFGYVPIFRGSDEEKPVAEADRYVIRLEPATGVALKLIAGKEIRSSSGSDGGTVVLALPNTPIIVEVQEVPNKAPEPTPGSVTLRAPSR